MLKFRNGYLIFVLPPYPSREYIWHKFMPYSRPCCSEFRTLRGERETPLGPFSFLKSSANTKMSRKRTIRSFFGNPSTGPIPSFAFKKGWEYKGPLEEVLLQNRKGFSRPLILLVLGRVLIVKGILKRASEAPKYRLGRNFNSNLSLVLQVLFRYLQHVANLYRRSSKESDFERGFLQAQAELVLFLRE